MILYILFFLHFGLVQIMMGASLANPSGNQAIPGGTSPASALGTSASLPTAGQTGVVQAANIKSVVQVSNQSPYLLKPSVVYVTKGMLASLIVDGQDVTEDAKKLVAYTTRWDYGKLGDKWTNAVFQFDPKKGLNKDCYARALFADGSAQDWHWKEDGVGVGQYMLPFIVVEAVYGGKGSFCDVTRHFQLGMKALISDLAIKLEKDLNKRTKLTSIFQALQKAKSILLTFQGDASGKTVTFKNLLQGWTIETTSLFPGQAPEVAQGVAPQWVRVWAVDRLLTRVTNTDPVKARLAAADLPADLKVIDNENKALDSVAAVTNKKKK